MTASQLILGFLRLAAVIVPAAVFAHRLRAAYLSVAGPVAVLAEAMIALSSLLLAAELLGLVGLDRPVALIPSLIGLAMLSLLLPRPSLEPTSDSEEPANRERRDRRPWRETTLLATGVGLTVVWAQWCLETANSLGSGMSNFDTLWYHMPFAARLAQSSSVTGIQFTQADPFVAYYPANSELFHAIGIAALHSDLLSPLLNLLWLAVALFASWCLGRPWRVSRLTLLAGCLAFSLPVLSTTQPGQAFNDTVGLAMLLAAAALVANAPDDLRVLGVAGLALGLAGGTKFTFIVPAIVLVVAMAVRAPQGKRIRVLAAMAAPGMLTAGWWYLHDLIEIGNPLGLRLHLGPLTLPGPKSPLAEALQETVISQVSHLSLWGSRFAPGLNHAIGPLWPLLLVFYVATAVVGIVLVRNGVVRALAATAALTGISYLFLPTGASDLEQGTNLFEVNLRYITPALVLGILLIPILARLRFPRLLGALAPALAGTLLVTQLDHALWPTQGTRHVVALMAAALVVGAIWSLRTLRPRRSLAVAVPILAGLALASGAVAFVVQRHYFDRRYLEGDSKDRGLGLVYRWAQGVAHSRIALYGTVLQYPLYGARDTNYVGYLGEGAPHGGFRPIRTCKVWRQTLAGGHYRYVVVVTPGPTAPVPTSWTQADPAMRLILHPEAGAFVYQVVGTPSPQLCP
ncbi:MAG: hypothetical protein ACYDHN_15055 [Solirubrobacteraceae bacterium]